MSKNFFQDIKPVKSKDRINPIRPTIKKPEPKPVIQTENLQKEVPKEQFYSPSKKEESRNFQQNKNSFLKSEPKVINQNLVYEEELNLEQKKSGSSKYTIWMVAIISLVFLLFAVSSLFTRAKVTVNPKIQEVVLNQSFNAVKDSKDEGVLPFSFISLSQELEGKVEAGEEKDYEEKAIGKAVIYNNFSSAAQNLLIDTRLEGSNGKLYKTKTPVIVPGIKDGKPGSVEVDIYANEAGEEYNTSPIDFKIFGFKGTPKYDKFYGRSKGDIAGGVKGKLRLAKEEDKEKVLNDLKISLEDKLFVKAIEQLPEGYLLFKGATVFKIGDESLGKVDEDGNVSVKIKGTLYGFLFEESKLTEEIVKNLIEKYEGEKVHIPDIKDLSFVITNEGDSLSLSDTKNITFKLNGTSHIVWDIDQDALKSELLNKPKRDFKNILSKYENIESADLVLHPLWRRLMPEDLEDIKVIITDFNK